MTTAKTNPPPIPDEYRQPHGAALWGKSHTVTPAVADSFTGDGKRLLGFQPLATRPDYYLIRVGSSFAGHDGIDEVIDALQEDFGERDSEREHLIDEGVDPEDADLANYPEELGFPVLALDCGYHWWTEAVWDGEKWSEEEQQ